MIDPLLMFYANVIATAIFATAAIRKAFDAGPVVGATVVLAVVVLGARFLYALKDTA